MPCNGVETHDGSLPVRFLRRQLGVGDPGCLIVGIRRKRLLAVALCRTDIASRQSGESEIGPDAGSGAIEVGSPLEQRQSLCGVLSQGQRAQSIFGCQSFFRAAKQCRYGGEAGQSEVHERNRRFRRARRHTHSVDVRLRRVPVDFLSRVRLAQIVEGKFFPGTQMGSPLQERYCGFRLSRAQGVDPQEQVDEIILRRQGISPAQQWKSFSKFALLMKVEGLLNQGLDVLTERSAWSSN